MLLLSSGIVIGLLIACVILLIEIRLLKTNTTITERIAEQLERLKTKPQPTIIKPLSQAEQNWQKLSKNKDIKMDDLYKDT